MKKRVGTFNGYDVAFSKRAVEELAAVRNAVKEVSNKRGLSFDAEKWLYDVFRRIAEKAATFEADGKREFDVESFDGITVYDAEFSFLRMNSAKQILILERQEALYFDRWGKLDMIGKDPESGDMPSRLW